MATGDERAFSELYDRLSGHVYGVVHHVVGDPARSEEVAREVLVEVWRTAACFDPARAQVRTWVMVLAHRRAIDRLRSGPVPCDRDRTEYGGVGRIVAPLTEEQRDTFLLAYSQGRTCRELAALLDVPLGTVTTRIRDGLRRLWGDVSPVGRRP